MEYSYIGWSHLKKLHLTLLVMICIQINCFALSHIDIKHLNPECFLIIRWNKM